MILNWCKAASPTQEPASGASTLCAAAQSYAFNEVSCHNMVKQKLCILRAKKLPAELPIGTCQFGKVLSSHLVEQILAQFGKVWRPSSDSVLPSGGVPERPHRWVPPMAFNTSRRRGAAQALQASVHRAPTAQPSHQAFATCIVAQLVVEMRRLPVAFRGKRAEQASSWATSRAPFSLFSFFA